MSSPALALLPPAQWRTYSAYTDDVKASIERRLALVEPALGLKRGHCDALKAIATRQGLSISTLLRWFYAAQKGDLDALADKRYDSKLWKIRSEVTLLPLEDIQLWQTYCLKNQRKIASAYRALLRDWRLGWVTTMQPIDPLRGHPVGWSRDNLRRHAPAPYELAAMRQGRFAASSYRPQVLTTRVGLRPAQYYVGDDVWHDHLIHWRGQRTPVRPLEASVLELSSAALVRWGLRPRARRADGTHENLAEREVRWIVAATLRECGYRADELGTTWLVESGTFAIRENLARPLLDSFGIKVESSAILGDRAWLGAYGAKGGGNPRFKTWLESIHNLRHNEMAALPGQVGLSRDRKSEELTGLVKYAERVADAGDRLALLAPELEKQLARPVQTFHEFFDTCEQVYRFINERRDHTLEGWRECGHEVVQYLLGETLLDESAFLALPPPPGLDLAAWGRTLAERGLSRTRLRSPAEVWRAGRAELTPLPTHGVALILGPDLGREQKVESGEFYWEDADLGPGEWRYFAEIETPEGRRELLRNGETYLVHANPFLTAELCVSDAKGRFMGVARQHNRACRADADAMHDQFKAVAAYERQLQDELARKTEPMMRERMGQMENNCGVLATALQVRERATEQRKVDRIDQAALLRERAAAAQKAPAAAGEADWT
jgi:hypothetical protein